MQAIERRVWGATCCWAAMLLMASPAAAAVRTFDSPVTVSWHTPSEWTGGVVPDETDTAIINGLLVLPAKASLTADAHVENLVIASSGGGMLDHSGGTLTVDSDLTLAATAGLGLYTMKGAAVTEVDEFFAGLAGGTIVIVEDLASLTANRLIVGAAAPVPGTGERRFFQEDESDVFVLGTGGETGELAVGFAGIGRYELRDGTCWVDDLQIAAGTATGTGSYKLLSDSGARSPTLRLFGTANVGGGMAAGVTGQLQNDGGTITGPGEVVVHGTKGQLWGTGTYDVQVTYLNTINVKFARNNLTTAAILNVTSGLTFDSGGGGAPALLAARSAAAYHVNWGGIPGPGDIAYQSVVPREDGSTPTSMTRPTLEVPFLPGDVAGIAGVPAANVLPRVRLLQLGQDILDAANLNGSLLSTTGNKAGQIRNLAVGGVTSDGMTAQISGRSQHVAGEFDLAVIGKAVVPVHQDPNIAAIHTAYGLTGAGVLMGQIEGGLPMQDFGCFADWASADPAAFRLQYSGPGPMVGMSSPHSTYVASVMVGFDPLGIQVGPQSTFPPLANRYNGGFGFTGVAPKARLYARQDNNLANFADLQTLAAVSEGMGVDTNLIKIINMSSGVPGSSATAGNSDALVIDFLVEARKIVFVKSAGNGGVNPMTGATQYASITDPGGNYNGITVGNAEFDAGPMGADNAYPQNFEFDNALVEATSSRGPTGDAMPRAKPDLVAQGTGGLGAFYMEELNAAATSTQIDAAFPEEGNRGLYSTEARFYDALAAAPPAGVPASVAQSGTSFAAPLVAGVAALMVEQARRDFSPQAEDPRVIKSVLMTTADKPATWEPGRAGVAADDVSTIPLSYDWGAGLLDAVGAVALIDTPRQPLGLHVVTDGWNLDDIAPGHSSPLTGGAGHWYYFEDLLAMTPLTATLNWYRHVNVSPDGMTFTPTALVDLNLFLYTWDGITAALVAASNSSVDNLEHLYVASLPASSDYLLRVVGSDFAGREAERYGLSWEIFDPLPIPEPGTWLLLSVGMVGLAGWTRARR